MRHKTHQILIRVTVVHLMCHIYTSDTHTQCNCSTCNASHSTSDTHTCNSSTFNVSHTHAIVIHVTIVPLMRHIHTIDTCTHSSTFDSASHAHLRYSYMYSNKLMLNVHT